MLVTYIPFEWILGVFFYGINTMEMFARFYFNSVGCVYNECKTIAKMSRFTVLDSAITIISPHITVGIFPHQFTDEFAMPTECKKNIESSCQ